MRREDLKKFATLSCANAEYNYLPQMWWPYSDEWKINFARDNHPIIDLNLMWNQSTCLNASITLSKLPIMMQTQIRATNMRWGEMTLKSLQPCLPILNFKEVLCESRMNFFQLQIDSRFLQPTCSKCICSSVCHSVRLSVRAKREIWSKRVFMRTKGNFSFQRALKEYYNYSLISTFTEFLIFLTNNRDCKAVDPYNARK